MTPRDGELDAMLSARNDENYAGWREVGTQQVVPRNWERRAGRGVEGRKKREEGEGGGGLPKDMEAMR